MIIAGREDYIKRVSEYVGDRSEDVDLSFIEDMSDTYDSISTQSAEIERLRAENADLRQKYKERFSGSRAPEDDKPEEVEELPKRTFEDLFK